MEESGIDEIRERLYARRKELGKKRIVSQTSSQAGVGHTWQNAQQRTPTGRGSTSWTKHFFIGALLFFVVSLLAGGAMFLLGGRIVSPERIDLSIDGPSVVGGGGELILSVHITNRNPVLVEYGSLTIDFPAGTRDPDDPTQELRRVTEELESLRPGDSKDITIRAVVFGQEGLSVTLPVTFEYRTEESNASVIKESTYDFLISDSPITLILSGDTTVVSGEEVTIEAIVRANSREDIPNTGISFALPFGFTVTEVTPASSDPSLISLGTLSSGEERVISLSGKLLGARGEKRVIRVSTGLISNNDLSVVYTENTHTISLIAPLLDVGIALEGAQANEHTFVPGESIIGSVEWENDLDTRIFDGEVRLSFSGAGFKDVVLREGGYFDNASRTLLFTRDTNPELGVIEPGQKGVLAFNFSLKESDELSFSERPSVRIAGSMTGKMTVNRVVETITSTFETRALIKPTIAIASYAQYSPGPFTNTGPMPPQAGKETLYTITLSIRGGSSAIADTTVSALLPSYVRFTGQADPADGSISINELTDELVWAVGELTPGGFKSVSFQVGMTPFSSHIGSSPSILEGVSVRGFDRFTQDSIREGGASLTTAITQDPAYQESWALVSGGE